MKAAIVMGLLILGLFSISEAGSDASNNKEAGANKGLTLADIGRGLQSAANNIGNEISKIGPAIGKMFKQDAEKNNDSGKPAASPSKKKTSE
jgi:hypothetical protein